MILEEPKPSSFPSSTSPTTHERTPLLQPSHSSDEPSSSSSALPLPSSSSRQHLLPSSSSISSASSISDEEDLPAYSPPESEISHLRRKRAKRRRFWILLLFLQLVWLLAAVAVVSFLWKPSATDDTTDKDLPYPPPPDWEPPEEDGGKGGGGEGGLGRSWNPSLPLPPSSDGFPLFCNPYPPSFLTISSPNPEEEDPVDTPSGPLSSTASFSLPLNSLDLFVRSNENVAVLAFIVETQSEEERDDENALVEVVANYDDVAKRDAVQICCMVPSDGAGEGNVDARSFAGLGLYPPKDTNDFSPAVFTVRLRLPPNTHIPSFRALSLLGREVHFQTASEDNITFGSIYVDSAYEKKAIMLDGIHAHSLEVLSLKGDIFLRNVYVRDQLTLVAARGEVIGLEGEVTVGACAVVDVTVGLGTVLLQNITLSYSPAESSDAVSLSTPGDREIRTTSFNVTSDAGAVMIGFNEEKPFAVGLKVVSNSFSGTIVRLPPSYHGSIFLHSPLQRYRRYFNPSNIPDPLDLGRTPRIDLRSQGSAGSKSLVGEVTWPDNESGIIGSSVNSRTRIGGITLSMEKGWRWDVEKGIPA